LGNYKAEVTVIILRYFSLTMTTVTQELKSVD